MDEDRDEIQPAPTTRRSFLNRGVAATIGAALATVIGRPAFAATAGPRILKAGNTLVQPSKRIYPNVPLTSKTCILLTVHGVDGFPNSGIVAHATVYPEAGYFLISLSGSGARVSWALIKP